MSADLLSGRIVDIQAELLKIGANPAWDELISAEKTGKKRKEMLKWLRKQKKDAENPVPYSDPPGDRPPTFLRDVSDDTIAHVAPPPPNEPPEPCEFPMRLVDLNGNPVCAAHKEGICGPCANEAGVKQCRFVCLKHSIEGQPPVTYAEKPQELTPAVAEHISTDEFDQVS